MGREPGRSRPLHNFALPRLKWGNQRFLRCMKIDNLGSQSDGSKTIKPRSPSNVPPIIDGVDDSNGIEAVREKLMFDLRVAADEIKDSILEEKELEDSNSAARPWNLRTRRAACKAPNDSGGGGKAETAMTMTTQQMQIVVEKREKEPRAKFSISLSREEIEKDFLAMARIRPPRRPKKRPKIVQRQIDAIFPGMWLTEVTPDTYKVPEEPEPGKMKGSMIYRSF
ncbi:unnamed protein product [Camellia sinensis]